MDMPSGATLHAACSKAVLMEAARKLPETANTLMVCNASLPEWDCAATG
jgi:hypothetical protein